MHKFLLDLLVCPACHSPLRWVIDRRESDHIEAAEAECPGCNASYSVKEGIGVFLTPDLRREDLWMEAEGGLARYLKDNLQIEDRLLSTPLEHLNPADQFFRGMALEAKGDFPHAQEAERLAVRGSYTASYRDCWEREVGYLLDRLDATAGPIFDLASGRCALVLRMLVRLDRPMVATDFSFPVMRRNRAMLRAAGQEDRVSLLVFDARRTPFGADSIETLTTNLGLPNIRDPGELGREIRRILSGTFLAISHFYPPGDENAGAIRESGLADHLYSGSAKRLLQAADLRVQAYNSCQGSASPTPSGRSLPELKSIACRSPTHICNGPSSRCDSQALEVRQKTRPSRSPWPHRGLLPKRRGRMAQAATCEDGPTGGRCTAQPSIQRGQLEASVRFRR